MACSCIFRLMEYGSLAIVLGYFASYVWELLWPFLIGRFARGKADLKSFGQWAVVTGATDGIGKAYARILAKDYGLKIVLISRTRERLDETANEIKEESGAEVKVITMDFGTTDLNEYDRLERELKNLDIGVLVNNVGTAYDYPEKFHAYPGGMAAWQKMIQINCTAATQMTYLILPGLLAKKKGAVINLSSSSGMFPTPLISVYAATKSYMDFLTRGLQQEYADSGVIFQVVAPFYVHTKMAKLRSTSLMAPDPMTYVRSALRTVGLQDFTVGYIMHAVQLFGVRLLPAWVATKIAHNMMAAVRVKALKRREKEKDK